MRWSEPLRQRKLNTAVSRAAKHAVEPLEPRTLLNATLTSPINGVGVAPGGTPTTINLAQHFADPLVPGTLVDVITPLGTIPVALSDAKTPQTVANFLKYVTQGLYQDTIFHRSVPNFVIQAGGYKSDGTPIATLGTVTSEAGTSNTIGTVAMALSTGPNSGTSQWFINLKDNSSTLDGTAVGGPFTVFGNVVYDGMTVANQIANLQIVNDSQNPPGNGIFGELPVRNYSGSTTPTSVPGANMVGTAYSVVPALTYTVTSDDPTLVTPTITGSNLTLTYGSGQGNTQVHVTAKDVAGNTATSTFTVGVGLQTVTIGKGNQQLVRFRDSGGTLGNIALTGGKGTATVTLLGSGLTQEKAKNGVVFVKGQVSSVSVATTGTSPNSVLTIWGQGGNGVVHLSGLTTDARLATLNAPGAALNGDLTATGAIANLKLGSASGGTMTIGAGPGTIINVGALNDVKIASFIPIHRLNVDTWTGTASINATTLGDVNIARSFGGTVNATRVFNFKAGSLTGGNWSVDGRVRSLQAQSIANWTASVGSLVKLNVANTISTSTIKASGNILDLTAKGLTSTNVYAGATGLNSGLPASSTEFTAAAHINALKVGRFVNSNVVAQRITDLAMGATQTNNSGIPFGVATQRITRLSLSSGGKKLNLRNVTTTAQVTSKLSALGITPRDLVVKIL